MENRNKDFVVGLALRPELYRLHELLECARIADEESSSITHVFVPDLGSGLESIEICQAMLSCTKRVRAGSGVIRVLEYDAKVLQRRLETIQALSGNRFVLGVGTGPVGPRPSDTMERMFDRIDDIEKRFGESSKDQKVETPATFVATLKRVIASKAFERGHDLLLNFCSPNYAREVVKGATESRKRKEGQFFACYIKVFYSTDDQTANRLLIQEFQKYDRLPQYHEMFVRDGVANAISDASSPLLFEISLANPTATELRDHFRKFREAGIDLPVAYPYFVPSETSDYKLSVIKGITKSLLS